MEKRIPLVLNIKEIFFSIQGEGPFVGHSAVFIRLAGCNLKCHFCDEHSARPFQQMENRKIINKIYDLISICDVPPKIIVVTGGEPFLQDFSGLVREINEENNFIVQVETNGSIFHVEHNYPYNKMIIVCSPKKEGKIHSLIYRHIDWYKFVIRQGDIIDNRLIPHKFIYVQPMDEQCETKNRSNVQWVVDLCLRRNYKISLQIHKILKIN